MNSLLHKIKWALLPHKRMIVIIGTTASGKSGLAKRMAQQMNGELVSCDSRQIYEDISIFSGAYADMGKETVPYHLLAFKKLNESYSVQTFMRDANQKIKEIRARRNVPIVVGGTAFWAQALMYQIDFPKVPVDEVFRETLHSETTENLFKELNKHDYKRAATMDPHNRKRIIRSLEIIHALGHVPAQSKILRKDVVIKLIYLSPDNDVMKGAIKKNIESRFRDGLIAEADTVSQKYEEHVLQEVGLGYKHVTRFLNGEINEEELKEKMLSEEYRYAKRQKTFCNKVFSEFKGMKEKIIQ